ncbi:MAG: carbon monoxide dehydrogenase subunit G [Hyphomicrobiaceae bacterium]|nr:carbon monoxide dehydrogenase subunit G [Hyphomicrobiaceae bacterium]
MDMTGEERIAASRETVWAALNDVEVLRQCITGCESLERQSDTEMTAKVKLSIGPVNARFSGKVTLSEMEPPNGYRIAGEGSGGAAGYAKGSALVRLVEDGNGTLLKYEARADVGGKLAQVGGRLIDATARKLAGEFFSKFGTVVGPMPAAAEGSAKAEAAVGSMPTAAKGSAEAEAAVGSIPTAAKGSAEAEAASKPGVLRRWFGKK